MSHKTCSACTDVSVCSMNDLSFFFLGNLFMYCYENKIDFVKNCFFLNIRGIW